MRRLALIVGAVLSMGLAVSQAEARDYRHGPGWGYGRPVYAPPRVYHYRRYTPPPVYYGHRRGNNGAAIAAGIGLLTGILAGAAIASQPQAPVYQDPRYQYYRQRNVYEEEPLYVQPDGTYGREIITK